LVINENVSSQDKERIKNLQNIINDNFYLKTNETLQIENKIKEIENDIKKYNQ